MRLSVPVALLLCLLLGGCGTAFLHPVASRDAQVSDGELPGRWFAETEQARFYLELQDLPGGALQANIAVVPIGIEPEDEEQLAFATSLECRLLRLGQLTFAELSVSQDNQRAIARRLGPFVLPVHHVARIEREQDRLRLWRVHIADQVQQLSIVQLSGEGGGMLVTSGTPEIERWLATRAPDDPALREPLEFHRSRPGDRRWFAEPPNPYASDALALGAEARQGAHDAIHRSLTTALPQKLPGREQLLELSASVVTAHVYSDRAALNAIFESFGARRIREELDNAAPLREIYPEHLVAQRLQAVDRIQFDPGNPGPVVEFGEFLSGWVRWTPGLDIYTFEDAHQIPNAPADAVVVAIPGLAPAGTRVVLSIQFVRSTRGEWIPRAAHITSTRTAGEQPTFEHEPMF